MLQETVLCHGKIKNRLSAGGWVNQKGYGSPGPSRYPAAPAQQTQAPAACNKLTKRKSVKLIVKHAEGREFGGKSSADVFVAALQNLGLDAAAGAGADWPDF